MIWPGHYGFAKRQYIIARAAVEQGVAARQVLAEVVQLRGIVAIGHQHAAAHVAVVEPIKAVVTEACAYFSTNFTATDGYPVVTATDADGATNNAARHRNRVLAEPGDQIVDNAAARKLEDVIVQFHVNPANAAAGHHCPVAVLESTDDGASGHQKGVQPVTLSQRTKRAATHDEIVGVRALADLASDLTA